MTSNDLIISKAIKTLRFPLTVCVVFIHFSLTDGLSIHGTQYGLENPSWFFCFVNLISEVIARIAVPLFFIISGYLFFKGESFNKRIYLNKLKSRFISLFIPFVLWNIVAIIWRLKVFIPGVSSFYSPVEIRVSFLRFINTIFINQNGLFLLKEGVNGLYPINVPLWFIRELMVVVIISPILYFFIKKIRFLFVISIGLLWLIYHPNLMWWGGGILKHL